jgi:hypothetical protein
MMLIVPSNPTLSATFFFLLFRDLSREGPAPSGNPLSVLDSRSASVNPACAARSRCEWTVLGVRILPAAAWADSKNS